MITDLTLAPDQIDLITRTVAKGCTKDELALFLHACKKTGLDPLMKQIYCIKRGTHLTIQTGIDGFRVVAERTGKYAPGREPSYVYNEDGSLRSATAYIKKQTEDGTWHEFAATAFWDEYVQIGPNGYPTPFWKKMGHNQLAKCAEALGLRRGWPQDLSGLYTNDEMAQADHEAIAKEKFPRLRGAQAEPTVEEEPADEPAESGEAGGPVEGDGSEGPDGPAPSEDARRRKLKLEVAINDVAEVRRIHPPKLRDQVKQKILDEFQKEHFVELNPLEHAKVMHWLTTGLA